MHALVLLRLMIGQAVATAAAKLDTDTLTLRTEIEFLLFTE
jgi:hypothetical protein